MTQLEIKFFFPLTEQIPLDLDFSQCTPHEYYIRAQGIGGLHGPYPTGTLYVTEPNVNASLTINTNNLTINGIHMPWYRKGLFKLLGFNYK